MNFSQVVQVPSAVRKAARNYSFASGGNRTSLRYRHERNKNSLRIFPENIFLICNQKDIML